MIFLNQIKDTRYVVQGTFLDDLTFEINVKLIFRYFDNGNIEVPIKFENKFVNSLMVNGFQHNLTKSRYNEILINADRLNNNSENIIAFTLNGKCNKDLIIISNVSKKLENILNRSNILNVKLPLFNFYTSNSKYRLFVTVPRNWEVYNKYEPFQVSHTAKNKIICYQSDEPNAIQNFNVSIKSDEIKWRHINEYF